MASMKEYPIILDDEELEDLLQVLTAASWVGGRHVESALRQLEILKAQNTEDYE